MRHTTYSTLPNLHVCIRSLIIRCSELHVIVHCLTLMYSKIGSWQSWLLVLPLVVDWREYLDKCAALLIAKELWFYVMATLNKTAAKGWYLTGSLDKQTRISSENKKRVDDVTCVMANLRHYIYIYTYRTVYKCAPTTLCTNKSFARSLDNASSLNVHISISMYISMYAWLHMFQSSSSFCCWISKS